MAEQAMAEAVVLAEWRLMWKALDQLRATGLPCPAYDGDEARRLATETLAKVVEAQADAEVERLREALAAAENWLEKWADHASFCRGEADACACGLNAVRERNRAALAAEAHHG